MPELWLRKCLPAVIFANSNLPEKRYRMCLSEEEIRELPEDSINVYKKNMFNRYTVRPDRQFLNGKYRITDSLCFADFLANYYFIQKPNDDSANENQPDILVDDLIHNTQ